MITNNILILIINMSMKTMSVIEVKQWPNKSDTGAAKCWYLSRKTGMYYYVNYLSGIISQLANDCTSIVYNDICLLFLSIYCSGWMIGCYNHVTRMQYYFYDHLFLVIKYRNSLHTIFNYSSYVTQVNDRYKVDSFHDAIALI